MKQSGPISSKCVCGLSFHRRRVRQIYQELQLGSDLNFSGRYLMNREHVGVPIRRALEDMFFALIGPAVLVVDLTGVEEMTGSAAEEIGPKLFGAVENHRNVCPEKYLVYDGLYLEIRKELDAWFGKYHRCVPAFLSENDDTLPIIGDLPPKNLQEVLEFCYRQGPVTSTELELTLPAATRKMTGLYKQYPWLVHRHKMSGDTPKSWRYHFMPLTPIDRLIPENSQDENLWVDNSRFATVAKSETSRRVG